MFAPPVAKGHAKAQDKAAKQPAAQPLSSVAESLIGFAPGQLTLLQRSTGGHAASRIASSRGLARQEPGHPAQLDPCLPPEPSWKFATIPVFSRSDRGALAPETFPSAGPGRQSRQSRGSLLLAPRELRKPELPRLQAKLKIGAINDPFEVEADRVAEQVMRMPDTSPEPRPAPRDLLQRCAACEKAQDEESVRRKESASFAEPLIHLVADASTMQRDADKDDIQEQLVRAFLNDKSTIQRDAADPDAAPGLEPASEEDEATKKGEEILMQSKAAGSQEALAGSYLESATRSLEGRGDPLPASIRSYMEPRFGHDFSDVRVHADARAGEIARMANARAFTIGRNLVFASGEYSANGSEQSRRLMAHELTHVIQQGRAGRRLQRKIIVGGNPYTPSADYLKWLEGNSGAAMREFVERMHNGGKPPEFSFDNFLQLGYEINIRSKAIRGIEEVHKGCCNYPDSTHPYHLDPTYWDLVAAPAHFKMKAKLPSGKHSSDAIESIFAPGAGTRLECLSMTLSIEYYSILKGIGPDAFNARFPSGIEISPSGTVQPLIFGADKKYKIVSVANKTELLPGDWVYFKNFKDFLVKHPTSAWQGENAIYLGGGQYRGFGVPASDETKLNQELVDQYNQGATPPLKTVADLIADGGGLLLNPVVRPIIGTLAP